MIARVWGKADAHELEFREGKGGRWHVKVPPDLSDGQYAVELYAQDITGRSAMWTGVLYMSDGVCHIALRQGRYTAWLVPERAEAVLQTARVRLVLRDGCRHGRRR